MTNPSLGLAHEDSIKILPALKMEMVSPLLRKCPSHLACGQVRQQQKLSKIMVGKWKEAVKFTTKEGSKKGSIETCLRVQFEKEGAGSELVQGLHHAGLLEEPLARLVSDLKQHFFEPEL